MLKLKCTDRLPITVSLAKPDRKWGHCCGAKGGVVACGLIAMQHGFNASSAATAERRISWDLHRSGVRLQLSQ